MTQKLLKITIKDLGELNQTEVDLLWYLRNKYRFGDITIVVRDGFPVDIIKTIERIRLGGGIDKK